VEELHEETGLAPGGELVATAIVLDEVLGTFEIIYSLNSTHGTISPSPEYAKVKWCCPDDLPQPLSPLATQMAELL
jgi:hypothetical protein